MSVAQAILDKQGYRIMDDKGNIIELYKDVNFNIKYYPPTIQEGRNYFSDYLIDDKVFKKNFCVVVPINILDIEDMGYRFISIDIRYASKMFDGLPWVSGQKKVYLLWSIDEGIPNNCMTYSKIPKDIQIEYSMNRKKIILRSASAGPKGFKEYYVGD
jgi:hypothetical protein